MCVYAYAHIRIQIYIHARTCDVYELSSVWPSYDAPGCVNGGRIVSESVGVLPDGLRENYF